MWASYVVVQLIIKLRENLLRSHMFIDIFSTATTHLPGIKRQYRDLNNESLSIVNVGSLLVVCLFFVVFLVRKLSISCKSDKMPLLFPFCIISVAVPRSS